MGKGVPSREKISGGTGKPPEKDGRNRHHLSEGRGGAGGVHPRRCHMEGHDVYDAEKYVRHPMRQEHILQISPEVLLAS